MARRSGSARPFGHEVARRLDAVLDVHHPPLALQGIPVDATIAGGTRVVHVHDADAPARPILDAQVEAGGGRARGTAVTLHEERWSLAGGSPHLGIAGRVVEGMNLAASRRGTSRREKGDGLGTGNPTGIERTRAGRTMQAELARSQIEGVDAGGGRGRCGEEARHAVLDLDSFDAREGVQPKLAALVPKFYWCVFFLHHQSYTKVMGFYSIYCKVNVKWSDAHVHNFFFTYKYICSCHAGRKKIVIKIGECPV